MTPPVVPGQAPLPARRLLARLRATLAASTAPLPELVRLIAAELVSEVCSVYVLRPGDILELAATQGLRAEAVGRTRLRVGEGIVGIAAATGEVLNLADAQNHPAYVFRAETGEAAYASMIAVPVRRAGRTLGVLTAQNLTPRRYADDEVEVLETVAMLLAEALLAARAADFAAGAMSRVFTATPLVAGIAIGPVVLLTARHSAVRLLAEDPDAERVRLDAAARTMQRELDELIAERLPDGHEAGGAEAAASREVLEAYRLVASEGGWLKRITEAVRGGLTAEAAVQRVAGELRERMRRIADPYLRERLADIDDLAFRLLATLDGGPRPQVPPGAILIARRIGPAQLLDWQARGIGGVVVEEASPSGHAAIIARSLGLPTLGAVHGVLEAVEEGEEIVLDAVDGQLILRPEMSVVLAYQRVLEAESARRVEWRGLAERPGRTADGVRVSLMLNVGLPSELAQLEATGAEGIGLFRTEIPMLARGGVADLPEQTAIYARVLDAAGGRPVLFRTLDLGGDKLLPGAPRPEEENPAMGWRSLRIGLDRPSVLRRQLRALVRAAGGRDLSVMFPMVATIAEFRAARALLLAEVARADPGPARLAIGTMLEVPALLWQLPGLFAEADFVSIGTNDLMQFLFAADRGAPGVSGRYDVLSAPVLDLLEQVLAAGLGKPVSVCGEAAARPLEALTLVGLGFTSLSMPASGVLAMKALLGRFDLGAFRPVLAALRRRSDGAASLREPIGAWAREQGLVD